MSFFEKVCYAIIISGKVAYYFYSMHDKYEFWGSIKNGEI